MRISSLFFVVSSLVLLLWTPAFSQSQSSSTSESALCAVDVRWLNTSGSLNYSRSLETPAQLSLLAHLSKGTRCSEAEVTLTATYLTDSQDFICSGTIRQVMTVSAPAQGLNISIRPFMQLDYVRWRNQPGIRGEQQGKRLACMNIDGTSDVGDAERQKAGWMRVSIGVMPTGGGLAVTEAIFRFVP